MAAEIEVYVFEDAEGNIQDWSTTNPREAREHAQKYGFKWLARQYEYTDTELVCDYTKPMVLEGDHIDLPFEDPTGVGTGPITALPTSPNCQCRHCKESRKRRELNP